MRRFAEQDVLGILLHRQHLALELRQILLHRVVQVHSTFIDQHHEGGGSHGFGLGGDPEQRVRPHGLALSYVQPTHRFEAEQLVLRLHQHDRARQRVAVHEWLHRTDNGFGRLRCRCGEADYPKREQQGQEEAVRNQPACLRRFH